MANGVGGDAQFLDTSVEIPDYSDLDVKTLEAAHRRRLGQTLALGVLVAFLAITGTSSYLAIHEGTAVKDYLTSFQPYILPTLGAIAGYAYGHLEKG